LVHRDVTTKAWAFYADANYHLTDKLTIGAGGRYNIDKKGLFLYSPFGPPYDTTLASTTFHKFTPRAIVRYEVAPRSNVYFSFSQGYKAGSYNANGSGVRAIASVPIRPEVVTAYELGFKTAQRMFRLETSAFYYHYKDLNISLTVQNPLGPAFGAATVIGNAPLAKIYGADLQVTVQPVDRVNVTVGATYLHARYGVFPNASGVGVDPTNTFNVNQPTQDWTHVQMARTPNFSANLAVDYTVDVAGGSLLMSGNVRYTDSFVPTNPAVYGPLAPADLQHKQRFRQPKYAQADASLIWTDPSDHWWVGVYGTNLTNNLTKLSYTGNVAGNYFLPGPPVQFGGKAGYKF
jgi:iron complex outermembrane receptor protein